MLQILQNLKGSDVSLHLCLWLCLLGRCKKTGLSIPSLPPSNSSWVSWQLSWPLASQACITLHISTSSPNPFQIRARVSAGPSGLARLPRTRDRSQIILGPGESPLEPRSFKVQTFCTNISMLSCAILPLAPVCIDIRGREVRGLWLERPADQWEASIEVTWSVLTNQRPGLLRRTVELLWKLSSRQ